MRIQNMVAMFSIILSISIALPAIPTLQNVIDDYETFPLVLDGNAANEWRSGWDKTWRGQGNIWKNNDYGSWRSWDGRGGFTALGSNAAWDLGLNPWDVPTTYSYPWFTGVVPWYR